MKRPLHLAALLLFALTQFFAPFAHAHVGGAHRDAGIHTSDLPHHLAHSGLSHCQLESQEAQAIGPQQEYQRDDAAAIPAARVAVAPQQPAERVIHPGRSSQPGHPVTVAYHRPHPQAPPA